MNILSKSFTGTNTLFPTKKCEIDAFFSNSTPYCIFFAEIRKF